MKKSGKVSWCWDAKRGAVGACPSALGRGAASGRVTALWQSEWKQHSPGWGGSGWSGGVKLDRLWEPAGQGKHNRQHCQEEACGRLREYLTLKREKEWILGPGVERKLGQRVGA